MMMWCNIPGASSRDDLGIRFQYRKMGAMVKLFNYLRTSPIDCCGLKELGCDKKQGSDD
jgi:hypothetical protein